MDVLGSDRVVVVDSTDVKKQFSRMLVHRL
jgi:hypothetical protein